MKQQVYEEALKRIASVLDETPSTSTHDHAGDRRRANQILAHIASIVREALGK